MLGATLLRGEQDGSRCQHEFASLVCLRGVSGKKYRNLIGFRAPGGLHQLFVRPANTIIRRFDRGVFFLFPCFPTSCLLRVFRNGKWDMSDEKLTKIRAIRMEIVGFAIASVGSRRIRIYLQDDFPVFVRN